MLEPDEYMFWDIRYCPNCGALLMYDALSDAFYCMYCGWKEVI